jgi:protease IV
MKRILIGVLTIIGSIVVAIMASVMLAVGVGIVLWWIKAGVPDTMILEVNFDRKHMETVPDDPIARLFSAEAVIVRDVVEALERAAHDHRVKALVARVGEADSSLAQVQEIRDAVLAFRRNGKPAIAYAETFGEFGPGNRAYYLATAFDTIYLHPSGDVGVTGLIAESPFLGGTLEKLDLTPRLDHREEYKTAVNLFTERQYTEPHKEATLRVIESQFSQIVRGTAEARGLAEPAVQALIDRGPLSGRQALEAKLVDGLLYRDQVYADVKDKVGEDATVLPLLTYLGRAGRPHTQGASIALIYGVGGITRGKSRSSPLSQSPSMGSDTITAAFRRAIEAKDVKAILFRVDSPGGSYVASDAIWRETVRARQAGKPVIISMGSAAASGGYFIAMAADKIVAQPATLTGSIGVIAGKMLTASLWDKVGVTWDNVHTSANATFWSNLHDYTPQQWAQFQDWLDHIYADFTTKVAEGRNLPQAKVLEVAKGRVWTGEDAKAHGLVDALGGFPVALRLAKEAAGIPPEVGVRLKIFPPRKTLYQVLLQQLVGGGEESHGGEALTLTLSRRWETLYALTDLAKSLHSGPIHGILTMPNVDVGR